jgi:hypothetical protein
LESIKLKKNAFFWDVMICGFCMNHNFRGSTTSIIRVSLNLRRLLVTANVVPNSQILVTLMIEVLCFSENVSSYKSHTA